MQAARMLSALSLAALLSGCGGDRAAPPARRAFGVADSAPSATQAVGVAPYAAASAAGGFGGPAARAARASGGRAASAVSLPPFTLFGWVSPPNESTTAARIQELAGAGLNVALPAWADSGRLATNLRRMRYAADYGVRCLAWDDRFGRIYLQNEDIALLDTIVADYASEPGFLGYYFTDEPLPPEFPLLARIYADLRARDPVHPAFDNLHGIYTNRAEWEAYVREFVEKVKPSVLCYDHYDFLKGEDRGLFVENLAAMRGVADEYGLPFWVIVLLVEHGTLRGLTPGELRWQVSHVLAYGARGVGYFTYWTPAPDPKWNWQRAVIGYDGVRGPWYDVLASFNPGVLAAGETLAGLTWLSTQHAGSVPRGGAAFAPDDWIHSVEGRAAIGRFAGESGQRYLLIANSDSLAARTIGLGLPRARRAWKRALPADAWSELRAEPEPGGMVRFGLEPGGFALLRLEPAPPPGPALAVGPNPARGVVRFAVSQIAAGARLEIVDTHGRRVWSSEVTPHAAPLVWTGQREGGGRVRPGIYFARVTDAGGVTSVRFSWLGAP